MANIPRHVGIILDGNGRWAEERGKTRPEGHLAGFENLKGLVPFIFKQGVEVLTVFAFSTENWKRDKEEVEGLFSLLRDAIEGALPELTEENIRIKFIGQRLRLSDDLQKSMQKIEEDSAGNAGGTFVIAIDYGGRDEIRRAVQDIVYKVTQQKLWPEDISEELISEHLDTAGLPDPDLIIRTSGEERISNFLIWQGAYAEFYTSAKYLPDFSKADFIEALEEYPKRKRRFGSA